jgi:MFS transporter, DHA2 family, multidrug resistance protein
VDTHTRVAPSPQAGRREWIGLAVLVLPSLLIALDVNALFLALPHLSADLGTSSTQQLWIIDVYGFLLAGLLITMGTLGDRIGRRKLLLIGVTAFGAASVLAASSTSPGMLIAARAAMGVAAATLMPSTLALISNMFRDDKQRATAIAVWATSQFAGAALGPVVTGLLLERFWWGSVFLLNVPFMLLLLMAGPLLLPEYSTPNAGRLDLSSVILSLAATLPIVYGIKELAAGDAGAPSVPIVAIVAGAAFGVVFVRRQLRLADPLLDLRLLSQRSFAAILATLVLAGAAMAGTGLLVTQYLQTVLGYSPAQAALWFAPMGLAVAVGTMLAPAIGRRTKDGPAIAGGLGVSVLGFALLTQIHEPGGLAFVVLGIAVIALGTGPLFALGTGLIIGSAPREKAGSAASMSETSNHFGGNLGFAVLGTISAAIYRHQMAGAIPAGIPEDAAQAAGETLAGATAAAAYLPAGPATDLLDTAHGAVAAGLNTLGFIGATLFITLAILVATAIPRAADREPDRGPRPGP